MLTDLSALPEGQTFVSAEHIGTSAWAVPVKLLTVGRDGLEKAYFLKVDSLGPSRTGWG